MFKIKFGIFVGFNNKKIGIFVGFDKKHLRNSDKVTTFAHEIHAINNDYGTNIQA